MEQETLKKIDEIKAIMKKRSNKGILGSRRPHAIIGIIADAEENDFWWLHAVLSSRYFSDTIKKIRFINTSDIDPKKMLEMISSCTFYIFICSGYSEETFPAMRQRLGFLFEWENLIIIMDNLEDSSEREKKRILRENQDCVRSENNVFLFSRMERGTNYLDRLLNEDPADSVRSQKGRDLTKHVPRTPKSLRTFATVGKEDPVFYKEHENEDENKHENLSTDKEHESEHENKHENLSSERREIKCHRVGIFSRSTDRDYSWLVEALRSEKFSSHVANIKDCLISNNRNFQEFMDDINQCTFGILYHSKNRGTVNITNVTGSLYDEELETLHMILGKEKVLVIIDDLEDSGDDKRAAILQEQYDIAERAADLLLVSDKDKKDPRSLRKKTDQLMTLLQHANGSIENQPEISCHENYREAGSSPSLDQSLYSPSLLVEASPSSSMGRVRSRFG